MLTIGVREGYGRPVWALDPAKVPVVIKYDYLAQTFGIAGGTIGRVAFIAFIQGVLAVVLSHKVILWCFAALQAVVNAMFILIIYLQCPGHTSGIWQHAGKAKCWDLRVQAYYGYFQGCTCCRNNARALIMWVMLMIIAFNAATDLYLALFSACMCWSLNLPFRSKAAVILLLSMGIV